MQRKCIDRNISLAGIQVLFEEADTHGSGYLDYLELQGALQGYGYDTAIAHATTRVPLHNPTRIRKHS